MLAKIQKFYILFRRMDLQKSLTGKEAVIDSPWYSLGKKRGKIRIEDVKKKKNKEKKTKSTRVNKQFIFQRRPSQRK